MRVCVVFLSVYVCVHLLSLCVGNACFLALIMCFKSLRQFSSGNHYMEINLSLIHI